MNEARLDNPQAVGVQADDTGNDARDLGRRRQLRLNGFLRELMRKEARMAAAELLGSTTEHWCGPWSRAGSRAA